MAVLIGTAGLRIPRDRAAEQVLGYTVANDVTMRDYQYKIHQWIQGKAWDASTDSEDGLAAAWTALSRPTTVIVNGVL